MKPIVTTNANMDRIRTIREGDELFLATYSKAEDRRWTRSYGAVLQAVLQLHGHLYVLTEADMVSKNYHSEVGDPLVWVDRNSFVTSTDDAHVLIGLRKNSIWSSHVDRSFPEEEIEGPEDGLICAPTNSSPWRRMSAYQVEALLPYLIPRAKNVLENPFGLNFDPKNKDDDSIRAVRHALHIALLRQWDMCRRMSIISDGSLFEDARQLIYMGLRTVGKYHRVPSSLVVPGYGGPEYAYPLLSDGFDTGEVGVPPVIDTERVAVTIKQLFNQYGDVPSDQHDYPYDPFFDDDGNLIEVDKDYAENRSKFVQLLLEKAVEEDALSIDWDDVVTGTLEELGWDDEVDTHKYLFLYAPDLVSAVSDVELETPDITHGWCWDFEFDSYARCVAATRIQHPDFSNLMGIDAGGFNFVAGIFAPAYIRWVKSSSYSPPEEESWEVQMIQYLDLNYIS